MAVDKKLVQEAHRLNGIVHEGARQYYHTRPMARVTHGVVLPDSARHGFEIEYDIKDLFTIGAITHSSILMTGGTDKGKTTLAKLVMNALFGNQEEGWHRLDVNTDFSKDAYTDPDTSVLLEGKKLSEGFYNPMWFLALPGFIWDEINRTPAQLANVLMHCFDKDITLPNGARVKLGKPIGDGRTYQFQIAAINEGSDYKGTFDIDKALRRRTVVEIPMDVFSPTPYDLLCVQKDSERDVPLEKSESRLEQTVRIMDGIKNIRVHPTAEMFISYLTSLEYCKNSLTGEKGGVASRNGDIRYICTQPIKIGERASEIDAGCEFLRSFENSMCPYVRGLSPGITKNLLAVARGFALLRSTKFVEMIAGWIEGKNELPLSYGILSPEHFQESLQKFTGTELAGEQLAKAAIEKYVLGLEVEIGDVEAALPFVGFSKFGIAENYIGKFFQGNRFEAVKFVIEQARKKFEEGLKLSELQDLASVLQGTASQEVYGRIHSHCKRENPWMWRVLEPYIDRKQAESEGPSQTTVGKLYGD